MFMRPKQRVRQALGYLMKINLKKREKNPLGVFSGLPVLGTGCDGENFPLAGADVRGLRVGAQDDTVDGGLYLFDDLAEEVLDHAHDLSGLDIVLDRHEEGEEAALPGHDPA